METLMIAGVGKEMAVGMAWDVDASEFLPGLGISTKAMLEGVGVAGVAQLEKISAHRIRITECRIRCFTSYLNIKLQIHIKNFLLN